MPAIDPAHIPAHLRPVIEAMCATGAQLSRVIARGPLAGKLGAGVGENSDGDQQKALDVMADEMFEAALKGTGVKYYASEEQESVLTLDGDGTYALATDPLDGSSNIDVNVTIGTIFSVFEAGFLDAAWDGFPGIAFARAVELGNALVFPTEAPASFAVGRIAVSSVGEGRAFLTALTGRLSLSPAVLEEDSHDGEMSEALDGILYNLRLLAFHVEEASRSGRPLGVWG